MPYTIATGGQHEGGARIEATSEKESVLCDEHNTGVVEGVQRKILQPLAVHLGNGEP